MSGLLKTLRQFAIAALGVLLVASVASAQLTKAKPRSPRTEGKVTAIRVPVPVYGGPTVYKSGMKIDCPAFFSFDFIITTDGPAEVKYTWVFSDGHAQPPTPPSKFARSGRTIFGGGWNVGKPGETFKGWVKLKVLSPNEVVSNRASIFVRCEK